MWRHLHHEQMFIGVHSSAHKAFCKVLSFTILWDVMNTAASSGHQQEFKLTVPKCALLPQLGQGGHKEGIQYTNDVFQNDEDGDSTGSSGPEERSIMAGGKPRKAAGDFLFYEPSVAPALLRDDTSQEGSDKTDNEKEVKPILTKERRMDEGYKSVWFKEDIDPNAKEEVVIIPASREDDSEEEDEDRSSSGRGEDEDDILQIKSPRVIFSDVDLDSGLGVKMEDPAEDSESDEGLNVDL